LDQAKTDEKVWNRIAETLCRIVYKIELKDKFKNRIMEANMNSLCNSNIYSGSNQQMAFCEPLKNNIIDNSLDDCYRSDSTLTSNNNIYGNVNNFAVQGNFTNQYNSVGIFSITTTMNNPIFNNNSLPTSVNSLTNDFSKGLKISQVQYNLVNSSTTVNNNSNMTTSSEMMNDNDDSMKNSMSVESEVSFSIMRSEDGLPMLLALQFEYIFSKYSYINIFFNIIIFNL